MEILFIGGFFPEEMRESIYNQSIYNVDSAADGLQKNILEGLINNKQADVKILTSVFIGSYPKKFRSFWIKSFEFKWGGIYPSRHIGFLNIFGIKHVIRSIRTAFEAGVWAAHSSKNSAIIIYSLHTPFIFAAWVAKKINPSLRLCIVIPDLPEFMNLSITTSFALTAAKAFDMYIQKNLMLPIDTYVILTEHMASRLQLKKPYIVMEGITSPVLEPDNIISKLQEDNKIITYTGTLSLAYGIENLLIAFSQMTDPSLRLWVCGGGEGEAIVREASSRDPRIKYWGIIDRIESQRIQTLSTLLINPRGPEGEFTKYSFPSKILEYMLSGRPVLACPLPGIPQDYLHYFFPLHDTSPKGIAEALNEVLSKPKEELEKMGIYGKNYVSTYKNSRIQVERLLNLLGSRQ